MNTFAFFVGVAFVAIAIKPAVLKARRDLRQVRVDIRDLTRRSAGLSQQVRTLARECRNQRLLGSADAAQVQIQGETLKELQGSLDALQGVDRRIIVLEERRGPTESGWIAQVRRPGVPPPGEPATITHLWRDGRYYHCFASDPARARRKLEQRLPSQDGYEIIGDLRPHAEELTEVAKLADPVKR